MEHAPTLGWKLSAGNLNGQIDITILGIVRAVDPFDRHYARDPMCR